MLVLFCFILVFEAAQNESILKVEMNAGKRKRRREREREKRTVEERGEEKGREGKGEGEERGVGKRGGYEERLSMNYAE